MDLDEQEHRAEVLANRLAALARQCRKSVPETAKVLELWELCYTFECHASLVGSELEDCEFYTCTYVSESVVDFLDALLPLMHTPAAVANSSSSSSSKPTVSHGAHSKVAAASRAAHVLQERKLAALAEQGTHLYDILLLTASAMQVIDTLFLSFGRQFRDHHESSSGAFSHCEVTAEISGKMFGQGKLVKSLYMVLSFLLRCVRKRRLLQHVSSGDLCPSFEQVQSAACENACFALAHMYDAIMALSCTDSFTVLHSFPPRLIDMLSCLACEGLTSSQESAWVVSLLLQSKSLISHTGNKVFGYLQCPASKVLSQHVLPCAVRHGNAEELRQTLAVMTAYHPELDSDHLLPVHMRTSTTWTHTTPVVDQERNPAIGARAEDETCEGYFLPRAGYHTLAQVVGQLTTKCAVVFSVRGQATHAVEENHALIPQIIAVLLSLQRPQALKGAGLLPSQSLQALTLQEVLVTVARLSTALATQLLHNLKLEHVGCPAPSSTHNVSGCVGLKNQHSPGAVKCTQCSVLADGITAMLLQIMRLYHPPAHVKAKIRSGELLLHFASLHPCMFGPGHTPSVAVMYFVYVGVSTVLSLTSGKFRCI